ncbi:hypothetical protein AOLI_G00111540 [Acnodon oligacanthus]
MGKSRRLEEAALALALALSVCGAVRRSRAGERSTSSAASASAASAFHRFLLEKRRWDFSYAALPPVGRQRECTKQTFARFLTQPASEFSSALSAGGSQGCQEKLWVSDWR